VHHPRFRSAEPIFASALPGPHPDFQVVVVRGVRVKGIARLGLAPRCDQVFLGLFPCGVSIVAGSAYQPSIRASGLGNGAFVDEL